MKRHLNMDTINPTKPFHTGEPECCITVQYLMRCQVGGDDDEAAPEDGHAQTYGTLVAGDTHHTTGDAGGRHLADVRNEGGDAENQHHDSYSAVWHTVSAHSLLRNGSRMRGLHLSVMGLGTRDNDDVLGEEGDAEDQRHDARRR